MSDKGGRLLSQDLVYQHFPMQYIQFKDSAQGSNMAFPNYTNSSYSNYFNMAWACNIPNTHCNRYFFVNKNHRLLWRFAAACGGYNISGSVYYHDRSGDAIVNNFNVKVY